MNYKDRLKLFNSTEKYRNEVTFLINMIDPQVDDVILDYGCGLGYTARAIMDHYNSIVYGFDVNNYLLYKVRKYKNEEIDKCYMMHSFAHIEAPEAALYGIHQRMKKEGSIYIVTPNKLFCDSIENENYNPDPTVVKHYAPGEIDKILKGSGFEIKISGMFGEYSNDQAERLFIKACKT